MKFDDSRIQPIERAGDSLLSTHKVLRNTYGLLSMTLIFSAFCAWMGVASNIQPSLTFSLVTFGGSIALMFLVSALAQSSLGLVAVFAFTGLMGFSLGPLLNLILSHVHNGAELIATAFGGTGLIFVGLSSYILTTKRDMSALGKTLFIGTMVVLIASLANLFFHLSALQLALSAVMVVLSAGWILWDTSQIIHGGQTNYILATVSLYVDLYNLFLSLLHLLLAFSGNDRNN